MASVVAIYVYIYMYNIFSIDIKYNLKNYCRVF